MHKGSSVLAIDHLLHGYDKGHRLLAASIELPKTVSELLLTRSDAAVSGYNSSNPPYLSGYPLPEIAAYAFSRTWPAVGMPRPGCVWTHTLIIPYAYLALVENLEELTQLFIEPTKESSLDIYRQKITAPVFSSTLTDDLAPPTHALQRLLYQFYGEPSQEIEMTWTGFAENLLFKVWNQQWPKLRRSLSFRTWGDLHKEDHFDIAFSRKGRDFFSDNDFLPDWVTKASIDAATTTGTELREFLWTHGIECETNRYAFKQLVEAWAFINHHSSMPSEESLLYFLNWSDCPRSLILPLINVAVNELGNPLSVQALENIYSKICQLELNGLETLELSKLTRHIAAHRFEDVSFIFEDRPYLNSKLAENFLSYLPSDYLVKAVQRYPGYLNHVAEICPSIFVKREFWRDKAEIPAQLSRALESKSIDVKDVIEALIDEERLAKPFLANFSSKYIEEILGTLSASNNCNVMWLSALKDFQDDLLSAISTLSNPSKTFLFFVAKYLEFDRRSKSSADPWASTLQKNRLTLTSSDNGFSHYLLCRAFSGASPQAEALFKLSFEQVHNALSKSSLDYDYIKTLEKFFPNTYLHWWWDKCGKLREALILNFINHDLPVTSFYSVVSSDKLFEEIVHTAKSFREGEGFLKKLAKAGSKSTDRRLSIVRAIINE